MGRVLVEATFENLEDLLAAEKGLISSDQVRRVIVADALVDPDAAYLSVPARIIGQLGLRKSDTRHIRTARGIVEASFDRPLELTIQGRASHLDALEVPDGPVVIGHIPLLDLDFAVDFESRSLIGNPAHGGERMCESYSISIPKDQDVSNCLIHSTTEGLTGRVAPSCRPGRLRVDSCSSTARRPLTTGGQASCSSHFCHTWRSGIRFA